MSFDFNKSAKTYDNFYNTDFGVQIDKLEKELVVKFLSEIKTKNILEIGCGTGHWTKFLSDNGFNVEAIDIAEEMIKIAKQKNIKNASFDIKNVEKLPYPNNSIENVIAITSLEFVKDINKAISEIYRVLKPNGYFIVGCLNKNSNYFKFTENTSSTHSANCFTIETLKNLLKKFITLEITACGIFSNKGELFNYNTKFSAIEKLDKGIFLLSISRKNN